MATTSSSSSSSSSSHIPMEDVVTMLEEEVRGCKNSETRVKALKALVKARQVAGEGPCTFRNAYLEKVDTFNTVVVDRSPLSDPEFYLLSEQEQEDLVGSSKLVHKYTAGEYKLYLPQHCSGPFGPYGSFSNKEYVDIVADDCPMHMPAPHIEEGKSGAKVVTPMQLLRQIRSQGYQDTILTGVFTNGLEDPIVAKAVGPSMKFRSQFSPMNH
jgi:hypothetical protein